MRWLLAKNISLPTMVVYVYDKVYKQQQHKITTTMNPMNWIEPNNEQLSCQWNKKEFVFHYLLLFSWYQLQSFSLKKISQFTWSLKRRALGWNQVYCSWKNLLTSYRCSLNASFPNRGRFNSCICNHSRKSALRGIDCADF